MTKNEVRLQLLNLEKEGFQLHQYIIAGMTPNQIPQYNTWDTTVSLFCRRHLADHPLYPKIEDAMSITNDLRVKYYSIMDLLDVVGKDDEYWNEAAAQQRASTLSAVFQPRTSVLDADSKNTPLQHNKTTNYSDTSPDKTKVFVVHGHDEAVKQEMARVLEKVGFEAIILHEQPDAGKTIIEKIEANTNVAFAVVLYTECDLGRAKEDPVNQERPRARQNVVFEHGYLIAKLGRDRVCALVKGNVETPGDISGVVYTKMDGSGAWKYQLARNMQAVGIEVDANKLL